MKRVILILLIWIISFPLVSAFSFGEFFSDFFVITGMAVFDVKEEIMDSSEKFEKISIPEPKKVEAEEEGVEKVKISEEVKKKSPKGGKSKKKFIPECSDYLDNNINYLKKGKCKDNIKKILSKDYSEDYCSEDGITLMEYFCNSDNICEGSWYVCLNGCGEGVCLTEKKEEFKPDLKILSVGNDIDNAIVSVKNVGSKGTYFKIKILNNAIEKTSNINYYLEPAETINVELSEKIIGNYSIELLVDEDLNQENNVINGNINEETKKNEQMITGKVTSFSDVKKESVFIKFFKFLRDFF